MALISGFLNTIFCLLGLGLLLFLIAGLFAPFESMKWWAGWTDHGLEPEEVPPNFWSRCRSPTLRPTIL